jgi:uncharacterized membrane protein
LEQKDRLLPIILLAVSAASLTATIVLAFYGIYFFFFFIPLSFGIPWAIKRLRRKDAKHQNVEDLR